ncbi:hypothetical protein H632_c2785p0 [Helicosporidium sp. ATCC 50920]|nr:hypothetical protein H632_c2785p0 [Helicosporidium sp. ATCC 50920]|eukprot:KDD72876.1 hypothetical protein H632_c2785p0 [Helicosporidium sp. ATCC 50920]
MMSPGMVATPLLLRLADNPRSARFINVLADPPDDAAAWLVPRLRGARGNGTYVRFFTPAELVRRLCTARGRRNRFVPEDPESIAKRREHAE